MVRNLNDKFDSKVVCALKGIAIILMCAIIYTQYLNGFSLVISI